MIGRAVVVVTAVLLVACGGVAEPDEPAPVPPALDLTGTRIPIRLALPSPAAELPLPDDVLRSSPLMAVDGSSATGWAPVTPTKAVFEFDRSREVTGVRLGAGCADAPTPLRLRLFESDADGEYARAQWIERELSETAAGGRGAALDPIEAIAAELDVPANTCITEVEFLTSDAVRDTGPTRWRLARSVVLPDLVPAPDPGGDVPTTVSEDPCELSWTVAEGDEARVVDLADANCRRDGEDLVVSGTLNGTKTERRLVVVDLAPDMRLYGGYPFTPYF